MSPYLILFPFWGSCITPQTGLAMWCWREHLCENQEGIYGGVKHCSRIPLGISIPLSSGLGDGRLMLCQDGWFFKTNITISSETLIKGSQTGGRSLTRAEVYVMRHVCLGTSVSRVWLCATHELQSARLLCPWDSPGKNIGVGCQFLLQGILLTQGLNLCFMKD